LLLAASALLWFVVGALVTTRSFDMGPVSPATVAALGAGMFGAAALMTFLAWRVLRGSRLVDGIALAVAVGNVVLTLTDDVGAYDLAYLALSLALLASLLVGLVSSGRQDHPRVGSHTDG
jgi:hypothetical protein